MGAIEAEPIGQFEWITTSTSPASHWSRNLKLGDWKSWLLYNFATFVNNRVHALGKLQNIAVLAYCQLSCPHMWQRQDKARGLTTIDPGVIVEYTNLLDIGVLKDQHNW